MPKAKKTIVIAGLILLAIMQISFFPVLPFFRGWFAEWFNPVAFFIFVFVLFERPNDQFSVVVSTVGGLFLDLYSDRFFGFWMLTFLAYTAFVKIAAKKYVRIPSFW